MKRKLRHTLIKHGFIKPKTLAETREVFPFPYDVHHNQDTPVWVGRHMEKLSGRYLV